MAGKIEEYNLYGDFDMEKHKSRYPNYLEVLIDSNGTVLYAMPSHQEKAIELVARKYGITREEVIKMTPQEHYYDWLEWLLSQTGSISVWDYAYIGKANLAQKVRLKELKNSGLYKGDI